MLRITTLTLAALALAAVASASDARAAENNSNSSPTTHTSSKGEYAEFSTYDGNVYSYVWASKGSSPQSTTTLLNFSSSACTWSGTAFTCTSVNAFGTIPNHDFDVHGESGTADLSTDTSALPGYAYTSSCDEATWTCTYEELPYTGGWISLSWNKNSPYSYKSQSRSENDFVDFKSINQGRYAYSSTEVEGNLLGMPITNGYGSVGTYRDMSITITKNH